MHLHIVPLAVTMMAGPQILTAILRITGPRPVRPSLAYVGGIVVASTAVTGLIMLIVHLVDHRTGFSQTGGEPSRSAKAIQLVLIGLLVLMSLRTWRNREHITQPKWMGAMQDAGARRCFEVGVLLIVLMPGDLMAMSVVAINVVSHGLSFVDVAPFLLVTWLIAAAPITSYLLVRERAQLAMPKVRDWMQANAWIVNIAMYSMFVVLLAT